MEVIAPLAAISHDFQDHVVLVLRKAMFNREAEARVVAVRGFLTVLTRGVAPGDNDELALEIVNHLRRCFGQQVNASFFGGVWFGWFGLVWVATRYTAPLVICVACSPPFLLLLLSSSSSPL